MAELVDLAADPLPARNASYRGILRSSAWIGGSAIVNVGIGMVRTKALALLLGPAGYGLMGAYVLIGELSRSIAQVGLNSSGVRQIAEAVASNDASRVARITTVLRYASLVCALVGAALLIVLSKPISTTTFGDESHAGSVAWLAVALMLSIIAGWQGALLQGTRRIADIAKIGVIGGVMGTVCGVPLAYLFGTDGIVPMLTVVAASSVVASWWYCRKIKIGRPALTVTEVAAESAALFKLGLAFAASGLLSLGAAYVVRIIVTRMVGLDGAGVYYAAWTLGGLYIGFVLQALGSDFYPRLVGIANDNDECNRVVNEQAQVSLLLATPGVLATLTLAPLVISVFYSSDFTAAVGVLRWICLGMALRVLTWPIGYIVVAKNRQALFFGIDAAWSVVNVGLTWWFVRRLGVDGAGIAFFVSYIFHGALVYPVVRRLSDFRWSAANRRTACACLAPVTLVFCGFLVLPSSIALAFGIVATIASGYLSVRTLVRLVAPERLPRPIANFLRLQGIAR